VEGGGEGEGEGGGVGGGGGGGEDIGVSRGGWGDWWCLGGGLELIGTARVGGRRSAVGCCIEISIVEICILSLTIGMDCVSFITLGR
jgi:hypothetical protein